MDIESVVDVIWKRCGAELGRWRTATRRWMRAKFEFGFAVEWMRKDLRHLRSRKRARKYGAKLPVTALVDQFYAEVSAMGGKRWDTSSLMARLQRD